MKAKNEYKNKLFSILGDSISTLDGYSKPREAAFYAEMLKVRSDVFYPEHTWWGQVIDRLGGELLVNNSFSGSMVCKHKSCMIPSYGCSDERTSDLSLDGKTPDVIMVYMGTNDWGCGVRLLPESEQDGEDLSIFSVSYEKMLEKIEKNYPEAEIWCFTLAVSTREGVLGFEFPYLYGGIHIERYCDIIRSLAEKHGCRLIDLYASNTPYDTIDGFHPNAEGMKTLAEAVIEQI